MPVTKPAPVTASRGTRSAAVGTHRVARGRPGPDGHRRAARRRIRRIARARICQAAVSGGSGGLSGEPAPIVPMMASASSDSENGLVR